MSKIVMYGSAACGDCRRAKMIFQTEGVVYEWVDIGRDPEAAAYVEKINNGFRSVPTILFPDGEVMVEPSSSALQSKLHTIRDK